MEKELTRVNFVIKTHKIKPGVLRCPMAAVHEEIPKVCDKNRLYTALSAKNGCDQDFYRHFFPVWQNMYVALELRCILQDLSPREKKHKHQDIYAKNRCDQDFKIFCFYSHKKGF